MRIKIFGCAIAAIFFFVSATDGVAILDPAEELENDIDVFQEAPSLVETAPVDPPGELSLVPSTERIPEGTEPEIPPEHLVPPIGQRDAASRTRTEALNGEGTPPHEYEYVTGIQRTETQAAVFSPFQVPLISGLERNKWYVQIGVYTQSNHVENEISRIGTNYPLAIQNIGTDTNPSFRILLGPLNQGEGAAMLQRIRSIGYTDAFLRQN